jgi:hypothetical protein
MPEIYTVWCGKGRVGTYHTKAQAEKVIADIQQHPEKYLHIQEWIPENYVYPYVEIEKESEE